MALEKITQVAGRGVYVPGDDLDTDRIIPARFMKCITFDGLGEFAFYDARAFAKEAGEIHPLDDNRFQAASILLSGSNFGCGSSREHAVWALQAFGVRCVVGHRPAEFFVENALRNGLLALDLPLPALRELTAAAERADGAEPFTVDLRAGEISGPAGLRMAFAIDAGARIALLEGLDDIGLTLRHVDLIEAWERRQAPAA